jgi:hypothetical protein
MRKWGRLIAASVFIALAAWFVAWFHRQMMIDKCLDGGGAWDYAKARCDKD